MTIASAFPVQMVLCVYACESVCVRACVDMSALCASASASSYRRERECENVYENILLNETARCGTRITLMSHNYDVSLP